MSESSKKLNVKVSFDIEKLFYKSWFYKEWALKCKNQKTKKRLIKKAYKELKINSEEFKRKSKIEIVKGE